MNQISAHAPAGSLPIEHRALRAHTAYNFRVDDWCLLPAVTVEIRRHGTYVRTARVDAATQDSRMLWLSPEGVEARLLIDKLDGYEVWVSPEQLYYIQQNR